MFERILSWIDKRGVIIALLACSFSAGYLIFGFLVPFKYPFDTTIIYPLLVFVKETALVFCGGILLMVPAIWAALQAEYPGVGCGVMVIGGGLAIVTFFLNPVLGLLILGVGVVALLFTINQHNTRKALILTLFIVSSATMFLPVFGSFFIHMKHYERVQFNEHVYNLALITSSDMDCADHYFVVYQCDSIGIICKPIYMADSFYNCLGYENKPFPQKASLHIDASTGKLSLQLDDETIPIEDHES